MLDCHNISHVSAEDPGLGFPALCLHHLHLRDQGAGPAPLRLGGPEAAPTNIQALVEIAQRSVERSKADTAASAARVALGGAGIIIEEPENGEEGSWEVPLYFSEVAVFEVATSTFFVVGLRENPLMPVMDRMQEPFRAAWIISVENDEVIEGSDYRLLSLLSAMGALGAIRSDLAQACEVDMTPIGSGGCSTVYLGYPRRCSRSARLSDMRSEEDTKVAIKVLIRDPSKDSNMAIAEAELLMGARRHPNIIGFHGLFKQQDFAADGVAQWVMMLEYCSCGDLHEDLSYKGPVSEMRAAELMFGLLSALGHLHAQGIVHRDVKSENILLKSKSHAVLSDFGIAARLDDEQAMIKRCGSPGYCAPEILNSQKYGAKVDVFSAGVVLYFMLSAQLPFAGPDIASVLRRTLRCRVKLEANYFGRISLNMKTLIMQLLHKEVEGRLEAAAAFERLRKDYSDHLQAQEATLSSAKAATPFAEMSKEKHRWGRSSSHASTATPNSHSSEHRSTLSGCVPFRRSFSEKETWSGSMCESWTSTPSGREDGSFRDSFNRADRESFEREPFNTSEEGSSNQCVFVEAYFAQRNELRTREERPPEVREPTHGQFVPVGRRFKRFAAKPGPAAQMLRFNVASSSGPDEGAGPFRPEDALTKMRSYESEGGESWEEGRPSFEKFQGASYSSSGRGSFRHSLQDKGSEERATLRERIFSPRGPQDEAGGPEVPAFSSTDERKSPADAVSMPISPPASVPPSIAASRIQRYRFANQEQAAGSVRRVYVPLFKRRSKSKQSSPHGVGEGDAATGDEGSPPEPHRDQEDSENYLSEGTENRMSWRSWQSETSAASSSSSWFHKKSDAGQRLSLTSGLANDDDEPRNSKGSRNIGFAMQEPILEDRSTYTESEMEDDMKACLEDDMLASETPMMPHQADLLAEIPMPTSMSNRGASAKQSFQRIFPRASVARGMLGWRRSSAGRRSASASPAASVDSDAIGSAP